MAAPLGRDGATGLPGAVHVLGDPPALAAAAAAWLSERSATAVATRGRVSVSLAGGGTPKTLYELLASPPWRDRIAWERWEVYYGDERACPPDDPESNHHMAATALLDHVPVPAGSVHRMEGESPDLDAAAARYADLMARLLPTGPGGAPRLDVVLLGLGTNGHTASLFPGTPALGVHDRWAVRGRADYRPYNRITLTYPTLNAGASVAFLVAGSEKVPALRGVRDGTVPAAGVVPEDGELLWFLDEEAAEGLEAS